MERFETEHYIVNCPQGIVGKVKKYVLGVEKVWPTLVEIFSFLGDDFRKKYSVFFEEGNRIGGCRIGEGGDEIIKCSTNPDINWQIYASYPSNLWGALVHETIHGFMQPVKRNNNSFFEDETFDLIVQLELYKRMDLLSEKTKDGTIFEEQADKEGRNLKGGFYENCKANWKKRGFFPFIDFFKNLYQIEKQFRELTSPQ